MLGRVAIYGGGIAASSCVALVRKHFHISFNLRGAFSGGPTLLINPSTQKLLEDVFGCGAELLAGCPIIRKRVVLWGEATTPTVLPHFGVVVKEALLLDRLWASFEHLPPFPAEAADWSIYSTSRGLQNEQQHFGSRVATAVRVQLTRRADRDAVWIESLESGWLFLLPEGGSQASLISVGGLPNVLLAQSRLVAEQIEHADTSGMQFPAYPRIVEPLCAPGWLASGTGAMSFDPICGEGAGNAVREAILASAVIRSVADGTSSEETLSHYSSRLMTGFCRHLNACRHFYSAGRRGPWWDEELAALHRGIRWSENQLSRMPPPRFRLAGFQLKQLT